MRKFAAGAGAATLRVINGTGGFAATSGHVSFNGAEVLGLADFKHNQHVLDVPITLSPQNTVSVRLEGKPGSKITVLIMHR